VNLELSTAEMFEKKVSAPFSSARRKKLTRRNGKQQPRAPLISRQGQGGGIAFLHIIQKTAAVCDFY
jgi:hypothetical protein